jgi:signal transduction histidine kinase
MPGGPAGFLVVDVKSSGLRPHPAVPIARRRFWRVRDWRVRTKLAAVLAIPAIAFLAVTGGQVRSSVQQAMELDQFSGRVAVSRQVTSLIDGLQAERDRTMGVLAAHANPTGRAGPRDSGQSGAGRSDVDSAAQALVTAVAPLVGADPELRSSYQTADAAMRELAALRAGAQGGWLSRPAVFSGYSTMIADLLAMLPQPAIVGGDDVLGQKVRLFGTVMRAEEYDSQLRGRLYAACTASYFGLGDFAAAADARAGRDAAIDRYRLDAANLALPGGDGPFEVQRVRDAQAVEQSIMDESGSDSVQVDPDAWWRVSSDSVGSMQLSARHLLEDAINSAGASRTERWQSTMEGSTIAVLMLLLAVAASVAISRSMVGTLRTLRVHALDVAQVRLPRMIDTLRSSDRGVSVPPVDGARLFARDEVGEVGEAFTAVHASAVRLAVEQAQMRQNVNEIFVNLARRSQSLVERQLSLLDMLEAAEVDPGQLTNLFRLDHLATRLRRNDENLLVLAGSEGTRRFTDPVPLVAIILAAAAEIEQYSRIRHDVSDAVHVTGGAVADLVHLLAELLENATLFSPPRTWVHVLGWSARDGGAALMIQDQGIGMAPDAIARANRQLADPVSIDVAAAERMGLVVVGHLAARYGIRVEIRANEPGLAVFVGLPQDLLAAPAAGPLSPGASPARWLAGAIESGTDPAAVASSPGRGVARRAIPTRAEDVLGQRGVVDRSVWWTRSAGAATGGPPRPAVGTGQLPAGPAADPVHPQAHAAAQALAEARALADADRIAAAGQTGAGEATNAPPIGAEHTGAGLPVRVPMARLPAGQAEVSSALQVRPPDPDRVGAVLSGFYGGVQRAIAEDAEPSTDPPTME